MTDQPSTKGRINLSGYKMRTIRTTHRMGNEVPKISCAVSPKSKSFGTT
jgi:hypothetical protein